MSAKVGGIIGLLVVAFLAGCAGTTEPPRAVFFELWAVNLTERNQDGRIWFTSGSGEEVGHWRFTNVWPGEEDDPSVKPRAALSLREGAYGAHAQVGSWSLSEPVTIDRSVTAFVLRIDDDGILLTARRA